LLAAALFLVPLLSQAEAEYRLSPELKAITVYAPTPKYPFETDYNRAGGSATARLAVDKQTGAVTKVELTQGTGSQMLDNVVVGTLRKWRFKPGTVSQIDVPIGFNDYNPSASYSYFGTIKAIDPQTGTVTLLSRMGAKVIVAVTGQTHITSGGKVMTLRELVLGAHVTGQASVTPDRKIIARTMDVKPASR
jgi:TonB family protein